MVRLGTVLFGSRVNLSNKGGIMNIQQLEYIIAVDNYRHFSKAAEASFVTSPR